MKMFKRWKTAMFMIAAALVFMGTSMPVSATVSNNYASDRATESQRKQHQDGLSNYVANIKISTQMTPAASAKIDTVAANARDYIWNANLTEPAVASYVNEVKAQIDKIIAEQHKGEPDSANQFLVFTDNVATPTAEHGKPVEIIISLLNLSEIPLENLLVTPKVDGSVSKWPFEISTTGHTKVIASIPGSKNYDEALLGRQNLGFVFNTREDVLSGYYKLEFDITYHRNGKIETTTLSSFVKTIGAPGSGSIDQTEDKDSASSTPRVIVTGFETTPETIYAGDVFTVTIHIKNTSKRTSVSNLQVDMKATPEGATDNKYEAFLPTSGSNTVYINKIAQGGEDNITIEMTAKADLAQKPYVLEVHMEYEDDDYKPFKSTSSVSIPIKQASKLDSSSPEVVPDNIQIGNQSNVMFSIYNTGKTTLYNTQVKFKGASVSGGDTFVGKIDPGATGNVDAMINGVAATTDDGTIIAEISYEDDAGNVSKIEKKLTLMVTEGMSEDMNMGGEMEMMPSEEPKGVNPFVIGGIVAVVAVIGLVVFLKIRKKKKLAKELAVELEDMIDED